MIRCVDLGDTWGSLRGWLDEAGVLILPRLERDGPAVRLDADADWSRPATAADLDRMTGLLKTVIERFGVRAVYVAETAWDQQYDGSEPAVRPGSLAVVTIRVVSGGVVHELTLAATWYAHLLASE